MSWNVKCDNMTLTRGTTISGKVEYDNIAEMKATKYVEETQESQ